MRHGWWVGLTGIVATIGAAAAAGSIPPLPPKRPPMVPSVTLPGIPLPPVRPPDLGAGPAPPPPPATPVPPIGPPAPAPGPPAEDAACIALLSGGKVVARALPSIVGVGGCGIAAPVEMSAVIVAPARPVAITPPVTIDCAIGAAVADWVRDDLVPAFTASGSALAALTGTSGYACRGRNGVASAKLSEHGHGNAMDIGAFQTADGKSIGVKESGAAALIGVKTTACARFMTVLGPGSDGFHESHMHIDLEARSHGFAICHWDQASPAPRRGGPR